MQKKLAYLLMVCVSPNQADLADAVHQAVFQSTPAITGG